MEFLTEEHLRYAAISIAKIAFVSGLAGALVVHFILASVHAVADRLATRTVRSMRIRAARQRALKAS
ncbi:hypothetical protein DFO48_11714 [Comamonas sp. AG1104]|nr:hypothetical protein DFO48_11714 [Comamonas sp. AG1104]